MQSTKQELLQRKTRARRFINNEGDSRQKRRARRSRKLTRLSLSEQQILLATSQVLTTRLKTPVKRPLPCSGGSAQSPDVFIRFRGPPGHGHFFAVVAQT